ncbi:MBL fold metallo-hydrolase [Candidatus Woesearchaeota archaeon]|nr:MBL fold metallo-hydrolase [Candidatus Woesearchaeota archaeon]
MKITTIYDNYRCRDDLHAGWGFSSLIEINGKNILFDTGENPETTLENMERLNINVEDIDIVVISHEHHDHTGALSEIIKKHPSIKVYLPDKLLKPTKIIDGVYTTGALGTSPEEQSLIIDSEKGLVIMTGCAHLGIVKIVQTAKKYLNNGIYLVLGGFHLKSADKKEIDDVIEKLRKEGVKKIAPSHCTGEKAIRMFEINYGTDFIKNCAGKIIKV